MNNVKLLLVVGLLIFFYNIKSQVAINTDGSDANSSAILDVKSTDKGFLPPRMTELQRIAISNPTAGLVIWCTNCGTNGELQVYNGTEWTNMVGGTASVYTPSIGEYYHGGIVFYLDGSGGGLVCALNNVSYLHPYECAGTNIPGADGTSIGSGKQNTIDIISGCSSTDNAAHECVNLSLSGYSDWFLPSKNELVELYNNKAVIDSSATANGGVAIESSYHWSSSENSSTHSWIVHLSSGDNVSAYKTNTYRVRAIRAFPTQQNSAPVSNFVDFTGTLKTGETLTATYSYFDFENDPEGSSSYQWYRADDASGSNQVAISGATSSTYVVTTDDIDKYISFEVTPVAQSGSSAGSAAQSGLQGPIIPSIGDYYGGGVVFYFFESGDPGYVAGETHGLICSINDVGYNGWAQWSPWFLWVPGTSHGIGTGQNNTALIIAEGGTNNDYAARYCDSYSYDGYSDWFLPSLDELNEIYDKKDIISATSIENGGSLLWMLYLYYYWSSSQDTGGKAWAQEFEDGLEWNKDSSTQYKVRAVREF